MNESKHISINDVLLYSAIQNRIFKLMIFAFVYMQTNELADEAEDWEEWRAEATRPRRLDTDKESRRTGADVRPLLEW